MALGLGLSLTATAQSITINNSTNCNGWIEFYTGSGCRSASITDYLDIPPSSFTYGSSQLTLTDVDDIRKMVVNDGYGNTYTIDICLNGWGTTYFNSYCASFLVNGSYFSLIKNSGANTLTINIYP